MLASTEFKLELLSSWMANHQPVHAYFHHGQSDAFPKDTFHMGKIAACGSAEIDSHVPAWFTARS
ncbi:hypothetical protein [Fundidesulfovibrio putealis]|uniref:hypothetical protein n=1 Tax=Fundidesulfovibrio putealis TaxID=270496 RepID=UPI00042A17AA|nr:hypothetical protein [Fundidesulfovibrio putealis]